MPHQKRSYDKGNMFIKFTIEFPKDHEIAGNNLKVKSITSLSVTVSLTSITRNY